MLRLGLLPVAVVLALFLAGGCGGESTPGVGESNGTDASTDSGQGSGDAASDGALCVDIDLSTYDKSCQTASDCVSVTGGEICSGACGCGGTLINKSELPRYDTATEGLETGGCPCLGIGPVACLGGVCTVCTGSECADGGT